MQYKTILFDLDGTLTDPGIGITRSVAYALRKMGLKDVEEHTLFKFIGPPLTDSFSEYNHFDAQEVKQAVVYYREYYSDKGLYENELYEGIPELLKALLGKGYRIGLATSKPTDFAQIILEHFKIAEYFTFVAGSNLDGTRGEKAEVIEHALKNLMITDLSQVVMIGDREYDIYGAKKMGLDSIGVGYGYGTKEELITAGATHYCETVEALKNLLLE